MGPASILWVPCSNFIHEGNSGFGNFSVSAGSCAVVCLDTSKKSGGDEGIRLRYEGLGPIYMDADSVRTLQPNACLQEVLQYARR